MLTHRQNAPMYIQKHIKTYIIIYMETYITWWDVIVSGLLDERKSDTTDRRKETSRQGKQGVPLPNYIGVFLPCARSYMLPMGGKGVDVIKNCIWNYNKYCSWKTQCVLGFLILQVETKMLESKGALQVGQTANWLEVRGFYVWFHVFLYVHRCVVVGCRFLNVLRIWNLRK